MKSRQSRLMTAAAIGAVLLATAACGSGAGGSSATSGSGSAGSTAAATKGVALTLMMGSSGDAETNAVRAAAAAYSKQSGNTVTVVPASNLDQQLTQAMAGGSPPDVFYVDGATFQTLASDGSLFPYLSQLPYASDFYPALTKAFTYKGTAYCAPKDFSTLALEINTDMWKAAGLTSADIPTTWAQLEAAAKKLTKGKVTGLVVGDTLDRVGAFMAEAGGSYMNADGSAFTFDSPQNIQGLTFVQQLAKEGVLKFPKQVGAGWGGEAFGKGLAAMTVEGNWILGAMQADYPNVHFETVPMPAGPTGTKGTLSFTDCWGVASASKNQAAAVDFVKFLTQTDQQLTFAKLFGVMPSRQAAQAQYEAANPTSKAFIEEAAYAMPQVMTKGFPQVQQAFDSSVVGLSNGKSDPKTMLAALQQNASALLSR